MDDPVELTEVEQAVFAQARAALALPLSAREMWFLVVAQQMADTNLALGWNGSTVN